MSPRPQPTTMASVQAAPSVQQPGAPMPAAVSREQAEETFKVWYLVGVAPSAREVTVRLY